MGAVSRPLPPHPTTNGAALNRPTEPRVTNISLDAEQMPATITLDLPIQHAAAIAHILGQAAPGKNGFSRHVTDVYFCLSSIFDRFWDDGLDGYRKEDR
jgi:hypothetical protein